MSKIEDKAGILLFKEEINFYRVLTLATAILITTVHPYFSASLVDPTWERWVIFGLGIGIFLSTFFSRKARENIVKVVFWGLYLPMIGWLFHLTWLNNLAEVDVISLMAILFLASIDIKTQKMLLILSAYFLFLGAVVSFTVKDPVLVPALFLIILVIIALITNLILGFRNQMQEELTKSEILLRVVFEESPDALMLVNPSDYSIVECNEKTFKILGVKSLPMLTDMEVPQACISELSDLEKKSLKKYKENVEVAIRKELKIKRYDDSFFWGDLVIKPIMVGGKINYLFRISDVTSKKSAESSMRLAENILNSVDNLVLVANKEGKITYISPSVEAILGYRPMELLDEGWWSIPRYKESESRLEQEYITRVAANDAVVRQDPYESRYLARDGTEKWILWKDTYVAEDNFVIGIGYDYTELKKESKLRESIFKIADAAIRNDSLQELYYFIDLQVRRTIKTKNLYIALWDEQTDTISFPHYLDEQFPEGLPASTQNRKAGKGITEFLLRKSIPALLSQEVLRVLRENGEIEFTGKLPAQWLGIPLMDKNKAFGVLAIQDYENPEAFDENDLDILKFISDQAASVIRRKQAEEALRESEERFRIINESTFEGLAIHRDGVVIEANQAFAEMFGYEENEVIGMEIKDFVAPESKDEVVEKIAGEEEEPYEFTGYRKDGSRLFLESVGKVHKFRGLPSRISAMRDISERKMAEEIAKTAKAEAKLKALIFNSSDLITILDEEGYITYESPNIYAVLNVEQGDLMGKRFVDFVHEDDLDSIRSILKLTRGFPREPYSIEYRFRVEGGNWRYFQSIFNNLSENENVKGLLVNSRDITQRKQNELILLESEEKYRSLVETMNEGIMITDEHDTIIHVNHRLCEMLGYSNDELVGQEGYEILVKDLDQRKLAKEKTKLRRAGVRDSYELEMVSKSGESIWVLISGSPFIDGENNFKGSIGVIADITEIKNNQWALIESEEKYRSLVENATEAIVLLDYESHKFVEVNGNTEQLFGLTHDELMRIGPVDVSPRFQPDGRRSVAAVISYIEAAIRGEQPTFEWTHINSKGDEIPCEVRLLRLPSIGGKQMVRGTITDISERKRVEKALKESEEKFRMLFSTANDGIFIMDGETFIDCNERVLQMFQCSRNEIIGNSPFDFSPETQQGGANSRIGMVEKIISALKENPEVFDWKFKRPDGTLFDAEISLNLVQLKNKKFLQAMVRDITVQLASERALKESEARKEAILDAIPDLMFIVSSDGYIRDFKVNSEADLYTQQEAILHKHMTNYLPSQYAEEWLGYIETCLKTRKLVVYEYKMEVQMGIQEFEARLVTCGDDEVLTIIRNVTERKKAENELIKSNFELDSFVYRASHDLKAPLSSILGLLNLIETTEISPEVMSYNRMIKKSIQKLESFIIDLTDYSRNTRLEVGKAKIDFRELIDDMLQDLIYMENAEKVKIDLRVNDPIDFYSDHVRVKIIFNNLVSNAIKYQNLDKKIPWLNITVDITEEQADIVIADNGLGIPEDFHQKIFNMFFRASIQAHGSGLGLYIVKNAIEKLGGNIQLDSVVGEGSTFRITIPNVGR